MQATLMAKGLLSWVPGLHQAFAQHGSGTSSPSYCYGVWLKHLTLLWQAGMHHIPQSVVELGPGASVGTGVAALLSGAHRYTGIDAVDFTSSKSNMEAFHGLELLFRNRAPRPSSGFPPYDQYLDERLFPSHILSPEVLARALENERVKAIHHAVRALGTGEPDSRLRYCTWARPLSIPHGTVDLVFSHVVVNQVNDLDMVYANCSRWLGPGGWMSHHIDFTSLGTTSAWNGHRAYGEIAWKIACGRRPYFVNRAVLGEHLECMKAHGFDVVEVHRGTLPGGLARHEHAPRWRACSDEDLATRTAFVIARKRPSPTTH